MCVATAIARAARSRPDIVQRLFHGFHDRGMLPHGEIIVGAPHCDRLWPIMSGKAARIGKGTLVAQYVNEHAVATLGVKSIDCRSEERRVGKACVRTCRSWWSRVH